VTIFSIYQPVDRHYAILLTADVGSPDLRHRQPERIITTIPFFAWRSDFDLFKELLTPSKIAAFIFQLIQMKKIHTWTC
jgi:hypothetical protein